MSSFKAYNKEFYELAGSSREYLSELEITIKNRQKYIDLQTARTKQMEQGVAPADDELPINMGDQEIVDILSHFKKHNRTHICKLHKIFKQEAHGITKPTSIYPIEWITREDLFTYLELDFETYCKVKHIFRMWELYLMGSVIQIRKRVSALEKNPLLFKSE